MTEADLPASDRGTVVLDIGPGVGALVLTTAADLNGAEIEVSRDGASRTHSRVRERRAGDAVSWAAVYPGLPAGEYTIWRDAVTPAATVTIREGEVTSLAWRG